jgi:hypothetical protein
MNKLNLTNIGGLPFDQQVLEFMQDGYSKPLGALAALCGDKTIVTGVELVGGNITAGWISYQGELIPFIGAAPAARVQITEQIISYVFEDNNSYSVETRRFAELVAVGGQFDFVDLQPLSTIIANKADLDTAVAKLALITHTVTHMQFGVVVGDIVADKLVIISIPDQGTNQYMVNGNLISNSPSWNTDNDVTLIYKNKTATSFQIAMREVDFVEVQNLTFDFTITKAI